MEDGWEILSVILYALSCKLHSESALVGCQRDKRGGGERNDKESQCPLVPKVGAVQGHGVQLDAVNAHVCRDEHASFHCWRKVAVPSYIIHTLHKCISSANVEQI